MRSLQARTRSPWSRMVCKSRHSRLSDGICRTLAIPCNPQEHQSSFRGLIMTASKWLILIGYGSRFWLSPGRKLDSSEDRSLLWAATFQGTWDCSYCRFKIQTFCLFRCLIMVLMISASQHYTFIHPRCPWHFPSTSTWQTDMRMFFWNCKGTEDALNLANYSALDGLWSCLKMLWPQPSIEKPPVGSYTYTCNHM